MKRHSRWLRQIVIGGAFMGAFTGVFASGALARTEADVRDAVTQALGQRHPKDSPEWWRALGPEAPAVMMSMYAETPKVADRTKLVHALAFFDDVAATDFVKQQAMSTEESVVRASAIRGLAQAKGAAEQDFVAKFLASPDDQTRLAAVAALRSMHDARADATVERHLKSEKAPWIVARANGLLPPMPPRGTVLTPSGSNEERVSADFDGNWRGFLVRPQPGAPQGMVSDAVTVRLKVTGARDLAGELAFADKATREAAPKLSLANLTGRGPAIAGMLAEAAAAPGRARRESALTGDLAVQDGAKVLLLRAPGMAATLVLRKDPAAE